MIPSARLAVQEAERLIHRSQRPRWRQVALQTGIIVWYLSTLAFVSHHIINDARAVQGRPPWRCF